MMRGVTLKDARRIFADELTELMEEAGLDLGRYTKKELEQTVLICTCEYDQIYAELMQWVIYGDDERAKTRQLVQIGLRYGRMAS